MGMADEMNSENRKITKEDFKEYIYVMVSTLNQMVNYIPLKHFGFKEVYNLTIEVPKDKNNKKIIKYFDNDKWDNNLTEVYNDKTIENIIFKQSEITNITTIKNKLNRFKDKKVFWNITGGQRPFILAINQIATEEDVVCYLEGNNSQMVLLKNNTELKDIVDDYSVDKLTIEIALKLMGFDIKVTKTSEQNFIVNHDEDEKKFYLNFFDKYIENKKLRENLILLNRDKNKENAKKEIKKIINISDKELNRNKAFGYILEKLAGYKILDLAKDKIADMTLGEKINHLRDKVDNYHIDEFDVAMLTKNGKFMIFECKSGDMEGDVAKSTKYSTYAVSGAYGLPILITPLLGNEIENLDNLDKKIYGYIQSAIKSAKRAGLEVWGLDDIEDNLKKYIEL
jgi:hypothetical protein